MLAKLANLPAARRDRHINWIAHIAKKWLPSISRRKAWRWKDILRALIERRAGFEERYLA